MRFASFLSTTLATAALTALALPSYAQFSLVTVRANIAENDAIDWGQFGPVSTNVTNPSSGVTDGGVDFTVSKTTSGVFQRRDQNNGWLGNFSPGDELLYTNLTAGPLTVDFGTNQLLAGGVQIQGNVFSSFNATVEALDADGTVVFSSALIPGTSNNNADDSAIFIGVESVSQPFARLRFNVAAGADFAINQASLRFVSEGATAPEPGALSLLAIGMVAFGVVVRRRK
ncbi:MAG: hypothetical protein OHK0029_17850 [Armatimonadaceae bacterium]